MGFDAMGSEEYSLLKDLRLEIEAKEGTFSLCFWVYLTRSNTFPSTIIHQVHSKSTYFAPFLVIDESKRMRLLPVLVLREEAPEPGSAGSCTGVPHALAEHEFPLGKWVHVGCEVSTDCIRLHINGEIVGERSLSSLLCTESAANGLKKLTLTNMGEDDKRLEGYVHNMEVFFLDSFTKDLHTKDPPVELSIDKSSASEIEEDDDGVWSIVGGKASCRRNFSLDVVLLDAFGQPMSKDIEVVASLLYADNRAPVENTVDAEAPLLASYDGIEFPSCKRPSKLVQGRASFKLKISQLSSKCENRLFIIRFHMPTCGTYPFLETFSPSIRCISRSRNTRLSTLVWRRSNYGSSLASDDGLQTLSEAKSSPLSKRFKAGHDKISVSLKPDSTSEQPDEECNSRTWTTDQVDNESAMSLEGRPENLDEADESPSDTESIGERHSPSRSMLSKINPLSDMTIFKYCLAGLTERSRMLKEIASSASDKEISELASQVSLYTGCSHHRNQILIAKRLMIEGTKAWNVISQNNQHIFWENAVPEIEEQFMKVACCSSRFLTQQDFELLRRIAGCRDYLTRENFEKMWCWLYPVAFTISQDWINAIWKSTSPKWIEGFITKEEAETSLQIPGKLQVPGTFVLRFPTSRSWPHPDAGSLIVTYVGSDYNLHHRLLLMDHLYSSGEKERVVKPLQDMLLDEPELCRLGRIVRSN